MDKNISLDLVCRNSIVNAMDSSITINDYAKSKVTKKDKIINFFYYFCNIIFFRKINVFTLDPLLMSDTVHFRCDINKNMQFYREATTSEDSDILESENSNISEPGIGVNLPRHEVENIALEDFNKQLKSESYKKNGILTFKIPEFLQGLSNRVDITGFANETAINDYIITMDLCMRQAEKGGITKKNTITHFIFKKQDILISTRALNSLNSISFDSNYITTIEKIMLKIKERNIQNIKNLPNYSINGPY